MRVGYSGVKFRDSERAERIGATANWSSGKANFFMLRCVNMGASACADIRGHARGAQVHDLIADAKHALARQL
jgi:hypothetical protein